MVVEIHINRNAEELTDTGHIFITLLQTEDTHLEDCSYCSIDPHDLNDKRPSLIIVEMAVLIHNYVTTGRAANYIRLRISAFLV